MIRNNQNRRRRGGNNNGPRPQQMNGGNNYGNRLDNRQRGNASQLLEKYRALARDAQQAGDRVTAEYYLQYADHYYRVLGDYREKTPADGRQRGQNFYEDDAAGYSASGDDGDDGDEDQDGDGGELRPDRSPDRSSDRSPARPDDRGDDNRSQWRDDRPSGSQGNRARDGQREPRSEQREARAEPREARGDAGRNDNRERQAFNANNAPRNRDDSRTERTRDDSRTERPRDDDRVERPRDDNRVERPRDDNRAERTVHRDRRPETQRSLPIEASPQPRPVEARLADEGAIPGLPGPATLRIRRPVDDAAPRAERTSRTPRRDVVAEPMLPVVETIVAEAPVSDSDVVAPRRRGRPRKIVDVAAVDG